MTAERARAAHTTRRSVRWRYSQSQESAHGDEIDGDTVRGQSRARRGSERPGAARPSKLGRSRASRSRSQGACRAPCDRSRRALTESAKKRGLTTRTSRDIARERSTALSPLGAPSARGSTSRRCAPNDLIRRHLRATTRGSVSLQGRVIALRSPRVPHASTPPLDVEVARRPLVTTRAEQSRAAGRCTPEQARALARAPRRGSAHLFGDLARHLRWRLQARHLPR
jgi:hypothetical protein